jgi:hypothetical protein
VGDDACGCVCGVSGGVAVGAFVEGIGKDSF